MKTMNIPLYTVIREDDGMSWHEPPKIVDVYIGDVVVHTHDAEPFTSDDDAERQALNAFARMLKLKIGDKA